MTQKSLNVTWHDHLQHISGLFQDLYENKKLVDVTLYCSGGSLKAHKIVLSACSPYFAKIFQECDVQHPIIILKGISFEEMHLLLEFMYKGSINILENDLDSLIQAGSYLEIKGMDVKNIPNNMKSTTKRSADESAEEPLEIPKKMKEDREENETSTKVTEQMQVEEKAQETPNVEIKKDPGKEPTIETPVAKTETLHRRETRFKGQKRVDVFSDNKIFKTIKEVASSPKHTKGKLNKDVSKGQINIEDVPLISRFNRPTSNSPVCNKKDKQEDKPREKSVDKEKKVDKLGNNSIDNTHPRIIKTKLNTTAPAILSKKTRDDVKEKKVEKQKINSSDNSDGGTFEDTLSKIVIKDVYSEEIKTSTPVRTFTKTKPKPKPEKKKVETATTPDPDREYIPVVPDVVMNESDSELNCIIDEPDDYDHFDDADDVDIENIEEYESGMLRVSHLECSQCNKIFKSDEELADHMKTHSNKPYKCDYCDSYFQRMSHLVRHRRTHTGEKPYSCRECGKCFSRQDKLKEHIRVHDENEYKPPPHLKKIYDPPLPYDGERRGRGRPRKNPYSYEEKPAPTEKRSRGRPRKYSLPAPGEHVENYDITNLPFGDFSYLTSPIVGASPLPDFSDLTITPVCYTSNSTTETLKSATETFKSATETFESATETTSSINVNIEKDNDSSTAETSKPEEKEKVEEKNPEKTEIKFLRKILPKSSANEVVSIINLNHNHDENEVSIINVNNKDEKVASQTDVVEIITLKRSENEAQPSQISLVESMKHLNECTIQAVSK